MMFKFFSRRYLSLALVLALVVAASFGTVGTADANGDVGLKRAIAAQEAHTGRLMALDGVVGTAVSAGPGGHQVLVLTENSNVKGIPARVDGVSVRTLVTGAIRALKGKPGSGVDRTARFDRPVPIGVSTGHPAITAGTIGARVVDGNGNVFALSNNHIYADENRAAVGDAVIQPGAFDGGTSPADDIGNLSAFEPIVFTTSASNVIDAAIALSSTSLLGNATPSDGYGVPSATTVDASVGLDVSKYGRTTGQTNGTVDAINATVNVGYDSGTARFVNQVIIGGGKFSDGGDSGSLIVTTNGSNPVALLFAGSRTVTIGNPIGAVLARFGVTVDGSAPPPPAATGSISGTVVDDAAAPIAGATVSTSSGQAATTAGDGTYLISGVPVGDVDVTASATGFGSQTVAAVTVSDGVETSGVDFALTPAPSASTASVDSITYSTSGGRGGTKDLRITISVIDDLGSAVEGAVVDISVNLDGSLYGTGSGTTGANGTITFRARNAPSGTYVTTITSVTAAGLSWDGVTPPNQFVKQ